MEEDSFHFKNKLIDFGNARFNNVPQSSKYKRDNIKISVEQICDLGDGVYQVESETNPEKVYTLSMKTGYCSCKQGQNKSPCKHKFSVSKHFGVSSFSTIPEKDPSACTFAGTIKSFAYKLKLALKQNKFAARKLD